MAEPAPDYDAYRAQVTEEALEYEDFVFDLLGQLGLTVVRYVSRSWQYGQGECSAGIEVKLDRLLASTGNLYVETEEKAKPDPNRPYCPSGIYRADNSWLYVIGNYQEVYIFAKKHLRYVEQAGNCERKVTPTSKGFLLPKEKGERHAARVLQRGRDFS